MSRIEEALEKAVEMRESMKEAPVTETVAVEQKVCLKEFEIGESIVNPEAVHRHVVCITDPCSPAAEQFRKLRARILRTTAKDFLNTIMVASADIGEGKTITAINLAVVIANEIDHTVLLVDADLKHPSIHKYLGIEARHGLSDFLMGNVELQDVLIKTGIGKLVFLPAGSSFENRAELLSSERMRKLVHDMKFRYKDRYIIFDSPPILATSESLPLSSYMDGILLVIQATRTTEKAASHAISQIKGSNILGVVFNNVPKDLAKNLYPYYYLYGNEGYYKKAKEG
ncbi:MAG: XrtA-associated tyrosine autokinase [Nitrospirota bacterium]